MTRLTTALEEQKTQLQADLSALQDEVQRRKDKDALQVGNALKAISREIDDWESTARESDDSDESTNQYLMQQARELHSRLVKMRSS